MNLLKIIRTKFFPPNNCLSVYEAKDSKEYILSSKLGEETKFETKYQPTILKNGNLYIPVKRSNSCFANFASIDNVDIEWFNTPEEARECAWEQFDRCYKDSMTHKEVG